MEAIDNRREHEAGKTAEEGMLPDFDTEVSVLHQNFSLEDADVRVQLQSIGALYGREPIRNIEQVVEVVAAELAQYDREHFCVVNLDEKKHPMSFHVVNIGGVDSTYIFVPNVFKSAILSDASSVLLFHNHPSSSLSPSSHDIRITKALIEIGRFLGVPIQDHRIVAGRTAKTVSMVSLYPELFMDEQQAYGYKVAERQEYSVNDFETNKIDSISVRLKLNPGKEQFNEEQICSPSGFASFVSEQLGQADREYLCSVNLDARHIVINYNLISTDGKKDVSHLAPSIFKSAIVSNTNGIILYQNHPNFYQSPDEKDIAFTNKLVELSKMIQIPVWDHVITYGNRPEFYSMITQMPEMFAHISGINVSEEKAGSCVAKNSGRRSLRTRLAEKKEAAARQVQASLEGRGRSVNREI